MAIWECSVGGAVHIWQVAPLFLSVCVDGRAKVADLMVFCHRSSFVPFGVVAPAPQHEAVLLLERSSLIGLTALVCLRERARAREREKQTCIIEALEKEIRPLWFTWNTKI